MFRILVNEMLFSALIYLLIGNVADVFNTQQLIKNPYFVQPLKSINNWKFYFVLYVVILRPLLLMNDFTTKAFHQWTQSMSLIVLQLVNADLSHYKIALKRYSLFSIKTSRTVKTFALVKFCCWLLLLGSNPQF